MYYQRDLLEKQLEKQLSDEYWRIQNDLKEQRRVEEEKKSLEYWNSEEGKKKMKEQDDGFWD